MDISEDQRDARKGSVPGSLGLQQPLQLPRPERLNAGLLVLPLFLLCRLEAVDVDSNEVDDGELDEAGEASEEADDDEGVERRGVGNLKPNSLEEFGLSSGVKKWTPFCPILSFS